MAVCAQHLGIVQLWWFFIFSPPAQTLLYCEVLVILTRQGILF